MARPTSYDASALVRLGFTEGTAAARDLAVLGPPAVGWLQEIVAVADPDLALSSLAAIAETAGAEALSDQLADDELRSRLLVVLGTSEALGDFLARRPEFIADLGPTRLAPLSLSRHEHYEQLCAAVDQDELRVAYRRALLHIAARDLNALTGFSATAAELADLAGATLERALDLAKEQVEGSQNCRLAVIAMGKAGGRELNYISDVDVVFVAEPVGDIPQDEALRVATKLASQMMRNCSDYTAEGSIWEVDANLRPEGTAGPLVRSLVSHVRYYEEWASTWEYQALLKARFIAGDAALGAEYIDQISPFVWAAAERDNFVGDVRRMRLRVIDHIPDDQVERELKLGPGGLRDVEFAVQLLQMVHGRVEERLRSPTTLTALQELIDGGYVGRRDGAAMVEAYEFLRGLEHRVQLYRLRRAHLLPDDPASLRRLGRSMGFVRDSAATLVKTWQAHRREVRRLHEKLFYRPLLEAVASLPTEGLRLTPAAAMDRLKALGYEDPKGALAHIQALTSGVSRRASIQRSLLPAMLSWFGESANPDAALLAFRSISEELGDTHWYLRSLRDEGEGAQQLARILSSSKYVTDLILRSPDSVAMFGDDDELRLRASEQIRSEMRSAVRRHRGPETAVRAIRRARRRELARIGTADLLGHLDILEVGEALTTLTTATIDNALAATIKGAESERGSPLPVRIAIVLMGRSGGFEAGYGSDADVMFVHEPIEGASDKEAADAAMGVAVELRRVLAAAGPDPALELDADLRPEGRGGPLVRSLSSYAAYYERWSAVWEAQALLRATAAIGDRGLCERFTQLIDPLRWPDGGIGEDDAREIRRIKARVDAERLPRGADPTTHLKLGRGGIADIEWTVQLLQMQHAHEVPSLRTTRTLAALSAATQAELIDADDADALRDAWRLVSRIRNGVVLMRSRPAESMVQQTAERAGLAYILGYGTDGSEEMIDEYMRTTRHARKVVERIFWD